MSEIIGPKRQIKQKVGFYLPYGVKSFEGRYFFQLYPSLKIEILYLRYAAHSFITGNRLHVKNFPVEVRIYS